MYSVSSLERSTSAVSDFANCIRIVLGASQVFESTLPAPLRIVFEDVAPFWCFVVSAFSLPSRSAFSPPWRHSHVCVVCRSGFQSATFIFWSAVFVDPE